MRSVREIEAMISPTDASRLTPQERRLSIVPGQKQRSAVLAIAVQEPLRSTLLALQFCELTEAAGIPQALELIKSFRYQALFLNGEVLNVSASELDQLRSAAPKTPKYSWGSHLTPPTWTPFPGPRSSRFCRPAPQSRGKCMRCCSS